MKKHKWFNCIWSIKCKRNGEVVWKEFGPNILVDEGEEAIVDTFFRGQDNEYFADDKFYLGLYSGVISESTTLATLPGEPSGNGYSRQEIGRTTTGFPTKEQDEGDWRVVSKTVSFTASGGSIGPVDGAFLATSSDNTGVLISSKGFKVERTILAGDTAEIQFRVKAK